MKAVTVALFAVLMAFLAVGCTKEEPKMSVEDKQKFFATLEDARAIARDNALFNAQAYRAENPRLEDTKVVSHGDSTQSPECPQGDGWASVSFLNVTKTDQGGKNVEKYKAKCSTVSGTLGCYLEQDFEKKSFAKQENRCDASLPFPLKKIAQ